MLKMVRTKPHGNFSSSQKATAEEALLEAAIENDSDAVLLMLSLVRDERRNKSLASHALAIAAKNGSEAVCRGLMDACGALDTDTPVGPHAEGGLGGALLVDIGPRCNTFGRVRPPQLGLHRGS